ncbi:MULTISPECIES: (deoxy)nucleoside triphosphate pyrophosphohydrolase [unclassified Clostridioides]|uniref:(deoxy)nucleoside triphosphate pyrophosphohydrolase n=1 Tax=unclassified Clostridioides TaxID=2635829 RepID=UPI001D121522|nr:(deoxy)nucleoside triphosphate pyrophosphohydrolase [Clostridioides sp. ES-S-0171-01]MCC0688805.1 (deoxy)nucleoside triphosphate pyrophosphohydrolase [Clostridioides sp. ES-S-0056-01]MCC0715038.1 (deoxy)nucleoside triphosphate pyrophosphohydrolase [Clostridioides sp. ES-S-0077-01]UDN54174.1 (deoxy)nucleoside triphosphate pyrophosphohydrolase [Clostridioides sp. ES-S-0054-01]
MKKTIKVVAAIIENKDNEILCALRAPNMSLPNYWEFPGGKVKEGESLFYAIEREIQEELSCKVKADIIFAENTHEYEKIIVNLIGIKCSLIEGFPTPNEHSKLVFLSKENLSSLVWAPADIPIVKEIMK